MRLFTVLLLGFYCSFPAFAQNDTESNAAQGPPTVESGPNATADLPQDPNAGQQPPSHPVATTYSDAYQLRLKIHRYASFATLPLFATEFALGQSLYNNPERGARRTAHGVAGAGIVGLFAVNTVTGVWNLWEGRHDTEGRKLRILHSVLMLASDAGFVAATATAPHTRRGIITNPSGKATHRDIAVVSISTGTVGYLIMLLKGK